MHRKARSARPAAGLRLLPLAGLLILTLAGCKRTPANTNTIVIGHVASLKGETATFGVSAEEGVRLALDEINTAGGVLGKQIVVQTEDDASQSDQARTAANLLITRAKAVALLGEIASSRSLSMAPEAQSAGVPMLTPGSTNPRVTQAGNFIFRACFTDDFQGKAIASFALNDLKLKRFAILFPVNSDYGTGLRDYISKAVEAGGGTIASREGYNEGSDVDFKSQLTKIKGNNPEAIFVTGYYGEAGLIAKQARELGITVPLLACDGWDSDKTVTVGGSAVEGCYLSNHYSPDEDRPEVKAFVTAYQNRFKNGNTPKVPDAMAVLGYDSMKLLADAIRRAGSTDGVKIRDALAATKDFPGVSGAITMDANRNASKPIVILKIENGQFKYVKTIKP